MAWQLISPDVTLKGLIQWMRLMIMWFEMMVKRMGMLVVCV